MSLSTSVKENTTILMVGCFDTKEEDFGYLHQCLLGHGCNVVTINTGVFGTTDAFPVHFSAEEVALAGGSSLEAVRDKKDRGSAIQIMGNGAAKIAQQILQEREAQAIIGMGGGGGTFIALTAMKKLPFGVPKLCVSTLATKDLSEYIGSKDITLVPSIVDVAGLNSISKIVMQQAVAAIVGMSQYIPEVSTEKQKKIAISVFGNTSVCVDQCYKMLTEKGYEVMTFHSVGTGGKAMEELILDGHFDAVLDITTTELADELCGGICSAGPNRLTAAAKVGIPQVVVPGCLDMVNFGSLASVPKKYQDRQLFSWAPDVTLMRTNKEENKALGRILAEKINASTAPVTVLLPLGGLSKIGEKDDVFYAPEIDKVLFNTLKEEVNSSINVMTSPENINTTAFGALATNTLLTLLNQ